MKLGKYKHYKGGIYQLLLCALHTETLEMMAVYMSDYNGAIWVRPLSMWLEEVETGVKRFTLIEE